MASKPLQLEAIYGTYRLSLRALRKAGPQRAGARKQKALQVVAERYKVPMGVVKQIVREQDELAGITHEHDSGYMRELEFVQAAEAIVEAHGDREDCPFCNDIPEDSANKVRIRVNPISQEISDGPVPLLSCFMCYLGIKFES